jgi:chromosome segregation ATPase
MLDDTAPTAESADARLARIHTELAEVLEQRLTVLGEAIASGEQLTRRIIAAEMEIERHRQQRSNLEKEASTLEQQLHDERKTDDSLKSEMDLLATERNQLQEGASRLDRDLETTRRELAQMRDRTGKLESEAEVLRNENTGLRTKHKTLEENLMRMRQLKDELMSSVSGLTQQMSGIAGGRSE